MWVQLVFSLVFSLLLISCGGGGGGGSSAGGTTTPLTLSGTTATGEPIVGNILVSGSTGGTTTDTIDASGNYEADVTGMTPPFIISAEPSDSNLPTQYSYASAVNITANVTPLTSPTLFNATGGQDLNVLANNWATQSNSVTQQQITAAQSIVNANFASLFNAQGVPTAFDIFSSVFNADGTAFDAFLDILNIVFDANTGTSTITVNGTPFVFDPDIDSGGGGGTGTPSGSVNLSGNAVSDLPFTTFTPETFSESSIAGVTSLSWSLVMGNTTYSLNVISGAASTVSFLVSVLNENGSTIQGWQTFPGPAISGLTVTGSNVTFSNVSNLQGGGFGDNPGPTSLTVDGTLSRTTN